MFQWYQNHVWNSKDSALKKFKMIRDSAVSSFPYHFDFDLVSGHAFNRIYEALHKVAVSTSEIVDPRDFIFLGNKMYNNLVVNFVHYPSIASLSYITAQATQLKISLPRFRYVVIAEEMTYFDLYSRELGKKGGYFFSARSFGGPKKLVEALTGITVDPAHNPEIVQINEGGGI